MNKEHPSVKQVARLLDIEPERLRGGLNLVEAAEVLGIAPSTLRSRAVARDIGYQRDGRAWRFYWWHLGAYLRRRENPAAGPRTSALSRTATVGGTGRKACRTEGRIRERARELGLI